MNKYLLPPVFIFLKFVFVQSLSFPWPVFEPVLCLALIYSFFHSLDLKGWLLYALYCGLSRDVFSLDVFGFYIFSCVLSCFVVSILTRIVYRQNWVFVFPVVFIGIFLAGHFVIFFKTFFVSETIWVSQYWLALARVIFESAGTALLAFPIYIFSKRCAPELIG